MFKTKNPEIKTLIWDLVAMEESVDGKGKKVFRNSFPKKHFRSCISLKKKISEQVEIHYTQTTKSDDGSESMTNKTCNFKTWNLEKPEDAKYLKEAHTDSEIEIDEKEIDEIAEDVEDIQENVGEIAEDVEEISHDVEEIETLKHFYKERDEIIAISAESFDEFTKAINV